MLSRDDVLRMAMEVDPIREQYSDGSMTIEFTCGDLVRFAALVAAHEREACAKVCDELKAHEHTGDGDRYWLAAFDCAAAIRERGV